MPPTTSLSQARKAGNIPRQASFSQLKDGGLNAERNRQADTEWGGRGTRFFLKIRQLQLAGYLFNGNSVNLCSVAAMILLPHTHTAFALASKLFCFCLGLLLLPCLQTFLLPFPYQRPSLPFLLPATCLPPPPLFLFALGIFVAGCVCEEALSVVLWEFEIVSIRTCLARLGLLPAVCSVFYMFSFLLLPCTLFAFLCIYIGMAWRQTVGWVGDKLPPTCSLTELSRHMPQTAV